MAVEVIEISAPGLAYICLGGFVVAFSLVSLTVKERFYINEVVLGTAFGILMGPHVANIFNPRTWGSESDAITLEVTRIVLAMGLFAIGVELPKAYLAEHAKSLLIMVVPTMAFGWVIVAGFICLLFPRLSYVSSLAIAACLTPTDPIICAAIVGGKFALKHVPVNLRRILSAESAANDGLAYPFLNIAIYLTLESTQHIPVGQWFLIVYQVVVGTILGAAIGVGFSYVMKLSHRKGFIDRESYVAQYLALSFLTIGIAVTIGSDDLLAAFAAGSAVSWDGYFNVQTEDDSFSTIVDLVLNCACFVYIGAWLPFDSFNTPELGLVPWRLVVLFIVILALRRIPSLLILYKFIPEISSWKEALFSGHFGPMGVGAVFVSTLALTRLPSATTEPQNQPELLAVTLQPIVSFVVLGSIIVHGLSIPFFTFGNKLHSRSLSLTQTFTSRSRLADSWLVSTRRASGLASPASDAEQAAGRLPTRSSTPIEVERRHIDNPVFGEASMGLGERFGTSLANSHAAEPEYTGSPLRERHPAADVDGNAAEVLPKTVHFPAAQ
ncbi:hypothetical protein PLICRDRAFT_36884 [Plicaturopsis crispa FD-325 SS-3]|nr:hypothetical protein PLICRDRAFT_36884 [Plicaturopsis crispa FD-325 SS-3]